MLYRVLWRDGSSTEDVDYAESMRLIKESPTEWAAVQPREYGMDCHPDNVKNKENSWGKKK